MRENPHSPKDSAAARRRCFEALYSAHQASVFGYALRRTDTAEDAADVIAEVFLVAWRRLDEAPAGDSTRLWLYGVARRVLANHRRGQRRRIQLADRLRGDLAGGAAADAAGGEHPDLAAVFSSLPDGDREVLALEAWEELDAGEIAEVLGCSRNAARIRLHRARRRLRAALNGLPGPGPEGEPAARSAAPAPARIAEEHAGRHPGAREDRRVCAADTIVIKGDIS
jgi:RNA polymerase sigma factor (sigma-70 family)